jgi:hypothetical protein
MNILSLNEVVERSRAAWDRARQLRAKGVGDANRQAAAARAAVLAPILRELPSLPPRMVADELERRVGVRVSYKTIERARQRLGLAAPNTRGGRIKMARAAAKARWVTRGRPKNRAAATKPNQEVAVE